MRALTIALFALTCLGIAGNARPDADVVVAETGGFPAETIRTVRTIAANELRRHGVPVRDESAAGTAEGVDDPGALEASGAARIFVLRLGRLDAKVPISLEEREPKNAVPVFIASHTAESIDEADTVIPRLVRAVLRREPVEAGAQVQTVTAQESAPLRKKPGEGLWVVGLGLVPLGGSFGWSYETRQWRLGVLYQGAEDDPSFMGIDGAWIVRDTNLSPYLGLGLGAVGSDDAVLGAKLEAGLEFFRLHGVRLLVGVNALIPFESRPGTDSISPGVHLRLCF